jgi:hypothetical protein
MEPEDSLPCTYEPASVSDPDPDDSSPYHPKLFL